ncbi:hypothetical protein Tco_0778147 [Tanacetum coccineum]
MPNLKDNSDPTTAMNMSLVLIAKAFKLNQSTPTNNNQRISSNPRNKQIAQPDMNMGKDRQIQMIGGHGGNQFGQYARLIVVLGITPSTANRNANQNGNGNVVAARAKGLQLQAEEYDLMAAAGDIAEIKNSMQTAS